MTVYISKEVHFCAAHKLYNPGWSRERNEDVFGNCANENWHGHNFSMIVTVKGEPDPETGFVMNFKDLKEVLEQEILEKVDHKNLNIDVVFMHGKMSTCENLVIEFWKLLHPRIEEITNGKAALHCIKLFETPTSHAEYYGE